MIRVDASAWPREYDSRYAARLPSPYADKTHIIYQYESAQFETRREPKSLAYKRVFFESFRMMFKDELGNLYYFCDWRQIGY